MRYNTILIKLRFLYGKLIIFAFMFLNKAFLPTKQIVSLSNCLHWLEMKIASRNKLIVVFKIQTLTEKPRFINAKQKLWSQHEPEVQFEYQ